jgi:SAM-dependent methyltransferase
MAKIEPFEKYTNEYEAWFEDNIYLFESELKALRELMPKRGKGIEIGVGSGRFALPLGIKWGIEPSVKMRKIAKSRGIEVVDSVAETLPICDAQFDFVVMVTTVCFLDDIDKSFNEVFRILKSGGSFVIGLIDKNSPIGRRYQRYKNKNKFYRIAKFYSVAEVAEHLKKAGFERFHFNQTIFHDLSDIRVTEPVKEWYGEGSFVVVRAEKKDFIRTGVKK